MWATVDLRCAENNFHAVSSLLQKDTGLCCIVKANAYGHGALPLSLLWQEMGAYCFGVATLEEAIQLRRGGISGPILILGYTHPSMAQSLLDCSLTQTVFSLSYAKALSYFLSSKDRLQVHIKLDTGMGRLGFGCDAEGIEEAIGSARLPALLPTGIFTHFAGADTPALSLYTENQLSQFLVASDTIINSLRLPLLRHCANSAATLSLPQTHFDMVRCGIALYGISPIPESPLPLYPLMSVSAPLIHTFRLRAGQCLGYGCTYRAARPTYVGVLPLGYAHGVLRCWGECGVSPTMDGVPCPILGRICMDKTMVDLSGVPAAKVGDILTLMGKGAPSCQEVAHRTGTIPYEVLCTLGNGLPHRYIKNSP